MPPDYLTTPQGRRIAHHKTEGQTPALVFLGGFKSDMEGTKALHLEAWARETGRAFLRLDYSGHGQSSGDFLDGAIGDWAEDAAAVIAARTEGPVVLVGSSMGSWISLLLIRRMPEKVCGFVGIASAPDFTEDGMWDVFDADQRTALRRDGRLELPSEYSDAPYIVTQRLIEDGRNNLVLRAPLAFPGPVRLLQGTADADVDMSVAISLLMHLDCPDLHLTLVKEADHRFSAPDCLALIEKTVVEILTRVETGVETGIEA